MELMNISENIIKTVTCIKGHPCIIFFSPTGEDYEYIGKYNLNLDKATPDPFGFKNFPKEYDPEAPIKFGWDENDKCNSNDYNSNTADNG